MIQLHWTLEAIEDREAIYEYIEANNPSAALALDELFEQKAAHLIDHPELRRPGRVAQTREFIVHPNYLLIYDVKGTQVRVLHAARQWPPA